MAQNKSKWRCTTTDFIYYVPIDFIYYVHRIYNLWYHVVIYLSQAAICNNCHCKWCLAEVKYEGVEKASSADYTSRCSQIHKGM